MKRFPIYLAVLAVAGAMALAACGGANDGGGDTSSRLVEESHVPLPPGFPSWRFESLRPAPPGLFVVTFSNPADERPWVIVFDTKGCRAGGTSRTRGRSGARSSPTATWSGRGRSATATDSTRGWRTRSARSPGSSCAWSGPRARSSTATSTANSPNGNVLLDTYVPETADLRRFGGPKRAAIASAEVQEVDPAGKVVWHWNSRGHIAPAGDRALVAERAEQPPPPPAPRDLRPGPHQLDRAARRRRSGDLHPPHRRRLRDRPRDAGRSTGSWGAPRPANRCG